VNALTSPATCPQSLQPELKHAAVRIERAELPWQIAAAAWLPADEALTVRERLRALFDRFDYGHCLPFGREPDEVLGLRFRAALPVPADAALLQAVEAALGLADGPVLRYADARNGRSRAMALGGDGALRAFLLAGDIAADDWVLELLRERAPAAAFGRALLAASRQPPQALAPRSPQVCACHDVSELRIVQTLSALEGGAEQRLQALQQQLRCGTQCGSCLPALRGLVQRQAVPEPIA
jgi:assimilatory nitrate reductase catalytic subunit